jgi:hypothetical protein
MLMKGKLCELLRPSDSNAVNLIHYKRIILRFGTVQQDLRSITA